MLKEEISERFSRISKICRPMTNCYSMQIFDAAEELWNVEESFIFSYNDHGIYRLVYFAKDLGSLELLLKQLPKVNFCLDVMTKDPDGMRFAVEKSGFHLLTMMMRLANANCHEIVNNSAFDWSKRAFVIEPATINDVSEINKLLWKTFDTRISHLLNDKELSKIIEKGKVTIHRNEDNQIDAVLQLDVFPKKFYVNQIINVSGTPVIHSMMQRALKEYVEQGGKYAYAWVDEKNVASIKFHAKYGLIHDGMWNMVFSSYGSYL